MKEKRNSLIFVLALVAGLLIPAQSQSEKLLFIKGSTIARSYMFPLILLPDGKILSSTNVLTGLWKISFADDDMLVWNISTGSAYKYEDVSLLPLSEIICQSFTDELYVFDPAEGMFSVYDEYIINHPGPVSLGDILKRDGSIIWFNGDINSLSMTCGKDNDCDGLTDAKDQDCYPPDLIVTSVAFTPAKVIRGSSITVTTTTKNRGKGPAGGSVTRYFLSVDNLKSKKDILLASYSVSVLDVAASSSGNTAVTIPANTRPGSYYIIACADNMKQVKESKEGNNCRASGKMLKIKK